MKQTWASLVIAGVFACTAVLGAQYSSGQSGSTDQNGTASTPSATTRTVHKAASRSTKAQKETVTVTGCLEDMNGQTTASTEPQPATGARRTAKSQANKYPSFMLANTDNGNGSYVLQGMDLSREIGQKVEITATEMPAPRTRATRGTSGSNSANENQPAQHLWVSSVKEVSATCQ